VSFEAIFGRGRHGGASRVDRPPAAEPERSIFAFVEDELLRNSLDRRWTGFQEMTIKLVGEQEAELRRGGRAPASRVVAAMLMSPRAESELRAGIDAVGARLTHNKSSGLQLWVLELSADKGERTWRSFP
jgi:hypothetical protein